MILIGSRSLALRNKNLLQRQPIDFDWVCTEAEYHSWFEKNASKVNPTKVYDLPEYNKKIVEGSINCEFEIITPGTSSELLADLVKNDKDTIETSFGLIPTLNTLFAIKDSHKYKKFHLNDRMFWKTAIDLKMMQSAGAALQPEHMTFHKLRQKESYNYSHPSLNQNKQGFFSNNNIEQVFEHDDIHRVVMIHDQPAYTYYLKTGEEVQTDKNKFFACSEDIRLAGVMEEAMVLSLERSLIKNKDLNPANVFRFALGKVASSITSGYFRAYAHDNLFNALKNYPRNFVEKFWNAVQNGEVKRLRNETN